jgi:serine protease Do
MSTRRSTLFYGILIGVTSLVAGMVIASRLDMTPASLAGSLRVPDTNSAPLDGPLDAGTFRRIATDAGPAVVSIRTAGVRERQVGSLRDFFPDLPEGFGGLPDEPQEEFVQGAGSGFIIDRDGYVLTNRHVIAGAERVEVYLADMDMLLDLPGLPAEVVGQDELTDTALLKLTTLPDRPLSEVKFGDSDQLAPGDWVMAIGNPFSLSNTVTVGVVSASGREQALAAPQRYEALIQTDAAINRGNSGGPLLNVRGEVVGINTMIVSNQTGGNLGIGFAVPINTVRDILPSLREGKVVRGRIAVSVERQPMTRELAEDFGLPSASGVIVSTVADGPAKDAGIRVGDVITEFNGEPVRTSNELVDRVMRTKPGTTVPVEIYRGRKPMTVQVTVAELDLQAEQASVRSELDPRGPDRPEPIETGFGMEIEELTPDIARQLRVPAGRGGAVVTRIDQRGAAAQRLAAGDVILSVNSRDMSTLDEVAEALEAIPSGRTARLIVWRQGREVLVLVPRR